MTILLCVLLFALAVLPVAVLMVYINRQDKFEKEPVKSLILAFVGGILAIPLDFLLIAIINSIWTSNTIFYSAFWEAGFPEELAKLLIFMIFIWRNKNFNEYFDGIVYASFIGLGFACVENILYVFSNPSFGSAIQVSMSRALLSVPAHFLFGVIMGYFLSMAKFKGQFWKYVPVGFLLAAGIHGLFDWLLMVSGNMGDVIGSLIYIVFLVGDFFLWKLGIKYIRKQQENSRLQAEEAAALNQDTLQGVETQITGDQGYNQEYERIDWNAGDKQ